MPCGLRSILLGSNNKQVSDTTTFGLIIDLYLRCCIASNCTVLLRLTPITDLLLKAAIMALDSIKQVSGDSGDMRYGILDLQSETSVDRGNPAAHTCA